MNTTMRLRTSYYSPPLSLRDRERGVLIRGACVAGVGRVIIRDSYGALFLANGSTELMRENNLNGIE
jgi:hypothetical protein